MNSIQKYFITFLALISASGAFAMGENPNEDDLEQLDLSVAIVTEDTSQGRAYYLSAKEQVTDAIESLETSEPDYEVNLDIDHLKVFGITSALDFLFDPFSRTYLNNGLLYWPRIFSRKRESVTFTVTTTNSIFAAGAAFPGTEFTKSSFTYRLFLRNFGTSWGNIFEPNDVVAIHEIGHTLGLGHGNNPGEIGDIKDYGQGYLVGEDLADRPPGYNLRCTIMRYCPNYLHAFSSPNIVLRDGLRAGTGDINADFLKDDNRSRLPFRDASRALTETTLKWQQEWK